MPNNGMRIPRTRTDMFMVQAIQTTSEGWVNHGQPMTSLLGAMSTELTHVTHVTHARKDCGCLLVVLLHVAGLQGFDSGGLVILEQEAAYAKIMEGRVRMPSICTPGFMLQRSPT